MKRRPFAGLPGCSNGQKQVLVVEDSLSSIILELYDEENENQVGAKYFLPLDEAHPLVIAISGNENRLFVGKADLRKDFGVTLSDFQTISKTNKS